MDHLEVGYLCGKGHLTKVAVCHFLLGSHAPPNPLLLKRNFPGGKAVAHHPGQPAFWELSQRGLQPLLKSPQCVYLISLT